MNMDVQGSGDFGRSGANVVLMGATGAGKSKMGWLLARLIGYGFIDLDHMIEARAKKGVESIFAELGEAHFRRLEGDCLAELGGLRSHVLALGGGAVMDEGNWEIIQQMGVTVWINTPAEEIARRLSADENEIKKRPLLAELLSHKDLAMRHKLLSERLAALIGQRQERYRQATLAVTDSFSTPESTALLVKEALQREGFLSLPKGQRPYDRWQIL